MNGLLKKFQLTLASTAFVLLLGNSAIAEDIEIYVDPSVANTDSRPNVLFIVDNSGSMDTKVNTGKPWDADTVWPGDCDTSHIYWKENNKGNKPPGCGTNAWFNASANHCAATVAAFDSAGYYIGRVARWQDASNSNYRKWATLDSDRKDDTPNAKPMRVHTAATPTPLVNPMRRIRVMVLGIPTVPTR